jgi:hypothetical protein
MVKLGFDTSQKNLQIYIDPVTKKKTEEEKIENSETNKSKIRRFEKENRKIENTKSTEIAKGYIIRNAYLHRQVGCKNAP